MYSEKVIEHFSNPRNVGMIDDADGIGEEGNPVCGDMMTYYIKVKDGRLVDIKYKTFGCGAAIAVSSILSTMAMGKTLAEAMVISKADIAAELDGLPKQKMHCSNLGSDALRKAIGDYLRRHPEEAVKINVPEISREQIYEERFGLHGSAQADESTPALAPGMSDCPFCHARIPQDSKLCEPCGRELDRCPHCQALIPRGSHECPECGKELTGHA